MIEESIKLQREVLDLGDCANHQNEDPEEGTQSAQGSMSQQFRAARMELENYSKRRKVVKLQDDSGEGADSQVQDYEKFKESLVEDFLKKEQEKISLEENLISLKAECRRLEAEAEVSKETAKRTKMAYFEDFVG